MSSLESFDDHYVNEEFDIGLYDYKAVDWFNTLLQIGSCNPMVSQSDWILEVKSMKTKKIITAIIAAVLVLALLTTLFIVSINHYFDTHTWATIYISGEINSDTFDAFAEEHEYLKGDNIEFGNVILVITDITHDGTVTFSVQQGNLYNEAGEVVNTDIIVKGVKANYKLNDGTVYLIVNSNRYQ